MAGVETSSVFELWSVNAETGEEHLLDVKTVSSYHPEAEISISSADPYELIPRTRADQPFTVTYSVSGLVTDDPEVQEPAKAVTVVHDVKSGGSTRTTQNEVRKNTQNEVLNIAAASPTSPESYFGEQVFTIYALPDVGMDEATELASQKVIILPKGTGVFTGIDPDDVYPMAPPIKISMTNMYPSSDAYIRVSKSDSPNEFAIVPDSVVQNLSNELYTPDPYVLNTIRSVINGDGEYLVELRANTPFGDELLSQTRLKIKSTIQFNGGLNSSE